MSYLIKPFDMKTGNTAPGIISYLEKEEDAIADVRSRSGLARFNNWAFNRAIKKIKDKSVRKFKSEDNE